MATSTIKVNGKTYPAAKITFNTICDLEEMGVPMASINKMPISFARSYATLCMEVDPETAGEELEKHMISGGNLEEIMQVASDELQKSDFFRALTQKPETDTAAGVTKASKEKTTKA